MKNGNHFLRWLWGAVAAATLLGSAGTPLAEEPQQAEERDPHTPPNRRELWVPMDKLGKVLAADKAVMLTREQYETLLRDAGTELPEPKLPPRAAVLTAANYSTRIEGKTAVISAELRVTVLGEAWAQIPLDFPGATLGEVKLDDRSALIATPEPDPAEVKEVLARQARMAVEGLGNAPAILLLQGKGEHTLSLTLTAPVQTSAGRSTLAMVLPPTGAGAFSLALPAATKVETSSLPVKTAAAEGATRATVALTAARNPIALSWYATDAAAGARVPIVATGIFRYVVDSEKVDAAFGFHFASSLGDLPGVFEFTVPPEVKVLGVEAQELAGWEAKDGKITARMQPGQRREVDLRVAVELPTLGGGGSAMVVLPVPQIQGAQRMEGEFTIVAGDDVVVKDVVTDASTHRFPAPEDQGGRTFSAVYEFQSRPTPPRVTLERAQPRLEADVDTQVAFLTDAVYVERTITLREDRGRRFSATISLPEGEELISVRRAFAGNSQAAAAPAEVEPEWRAVKNAVILTWADEAAVPRVFKLRSRVEPAQWSQIPAEGIPFALRDAKIEGAAKVTGYIALSADAAYRLDATPGETLERRDGRSTPVKGEFAWFRRDVFELAVRVYKRPAEVLAALTGYALPLEGVLDLHATMNYQFLHGGTRSVRLRVPKALAANFQFEGPQIAERTLAGDVWTITFQKELTGPYALDIAAQVPVPKVAGGGEGKGYSFTVAVPVIAPLDVARSSGLWAVEANTETEISFDAPGLNEMDALLAPRLANYQPQHRVIGVFGWLGAEYSLGLRGVRHMPASVLNTIVDSMDLDTVASPGGLHRHQAAIVLRTAGAQYLDVAVPAGAALFSLAVDGSPVKPVAAPSQGAGTVRVQLPAKRNANSEITIVLVYETPAEAWGGSGSLALAAPVVAKNIPILRSTWNVWLPQGFEFGDYRSNLRAPEKEEEELLVFSMARKLGEATIFPSFSAGLGSRRSAGDVSDFETARGYRSPARPASPQTAQGGMSDPRGAEAPKPQAQLRNAGLLPVLVEIPKSGRVLTFEGLHAPENVSLRYDDWWSRARRLWLWFVLGGALFYVTARRRPWMRTLWAMLAFTALPLCFLPTWAAVCNAMLGGWLVGLVLDRVAVRFIVPVPKEVLA